MAAGSAASEKLAGLVKLKLASLPRNSLVVLQLLDNTAFYNRSKNGSLIPYRREALTSRFFLDGDLILAPSEALTHSFDQRKILLLLMRDTKKSSCLLCRCSWRPATMHAPNLSGPSFLTYEHVSGLERLRKNIQGFCDIAGLTD
jgi:hypothetical protein